MLVLTRRLGQIIKIGENIEIMILGVKGNQVRIGTSCPPNVSIKRPEMKRDKDKNIIKEPSRQGDKE